MKTITTPLRRRSVVPRRVARRLFHGVLAGSLFAASARADYQYNLIWQSQANPANRFDGSVSFSSLAAVPGSTGLGAAVGISQFSVVFGGTTYSVANGSITNLLRSSLAINPAVTSNIISNFSELDFFTTTPSTMPNNIAPLTVMVPGGQLYQLVSVLEVVAAGTITQVPVVVLITADSPALASGRMNVANRFAVNQALFAAADASLGADAGAVQGSPVRGAWLDAMGDFGAAQGFDFHTGGVMVGRGFQIAPAWTVGFAGSSLFGATSGAAGTVNDTLIGATAYGFYRVRGMQLSVSETLGSIDTQLRRAVPGAGVTGTAGGSGLFNVAAVRMQYRLRRGRFFVEPDAELAYVHTGTGAMTESGAGGAALRYAALDTDLARVSSGVTGGVHIARAFGTIEPFVSVGGFGTLGNTQAGNTETYAGAGFTEYGLTAPVAAWTTGVGVKLVGCGRWRAGLRWGGAWGSGTSTQNLAVDLRYVW